MPKISVIVPVYNVEKYLHNCIDSILAQTFVDFELLLINDGSEDNSGIICEKYSKLDSRITVFHQQNRGVTIARELGVKKSQGDYITFVDSDDRLGEQALEILFTEMSLYNKEIDIVISGYRKKTIFTKEKYVEHLLNNQISWGCVGKLYKKSLFAPSPFRVSSYFNIGEDLMMQLNLSRNIKNDIGCIEDFIYFVTENPNSVTRSREFSVEYEQNFINEIIRITECLHGDYRNALYNLKMNSLYSLTMNGINFSCNAPWFRVLKNEFKIYGHSIRDKMLLFIPNKKLCRTLIILKEKLSNLIYKLNI